MKFNKEKALAAIATGELDGLTVPELLLNPEAHTVAAALLEWCIEANSFKANAAKPACVKVGTDAAQRFRLHQLTERIKERSALDGVIRRISD